MKRRASVAVRFGVGCLAAAAVATVATGATEPPVRVSSSASASRVYVGQRVTVSYFLSRAAVVPDAASAPESPATPRTPETALPPIRDLQLVSAPRFDGFWASELDASDEPPSTADAPRVRLRSYRLFPLRAGALRVEPPAFSMVVYPESIEAIDSHPETIRTTAEPLTIVVTPLPDAGRPDTFSGAVGRFAVTARVVTPEVAVGDAARIDVTVTGDGNLETTSPPSLEPTERVRVSEARRVTVDLGLAGADATAVSRWSIDVVPLAAGPVAVGPVRLDYFDPSIERYVVAQSAPIAFTAVARASVSATPPPPVDDGWMWYGWLAAGVGIGLFLVCVWLVWRYGSGRDPRDQSR